MDGLVFNILFNSISVTIGLRKGDCERLSVMKCCLGLPKIMSQIEIKPSNRVIQSRKRYPLDHVVASNTVTRPFQQYFSHDRTMKG